MYAQMFLLLVDISLGLISIYVKVCASVASARLILGSDWLIAIYNNKFWSCLANWKTSEGA